ncbi:MAG: Trm112 family protein [Desulfurococcaceae archaeon]|nr:Trm112 family protein [Desulfurococcaceae archaeon]
MKYRLMDLLACPMCKTFPLKLIVFSRNIYKREFRGRKPVCELYCSFLNKEIKDLKERGEEPPCEECFKYEIAEGILICPKCGRWYPIINEIPRMLPDEYRREKEDLEFLRKYKDHIPEEVLKRGLPYNLSSELK